MNRLQNSVHDFHVLMGCPVGDLSAPALSDQALRMALIDEEVEELRDALKRGDLVAAVDALADIQYVVAGAAVTWGVFLGPVLEEVHDSNMAKAPGGVVQKKPNGKILKPEGWRPPNIQGVLEDQVELAGGDPEAIKWR